MKQWSLAAQGVFEKYGWKSRRELFLDEMEQVVPWSGLEALVRALCQGRQRAAAGGAVDHAADVLRAAVVQPVGPRGGGAAV
jgi:hypothetical protein